MRTKATIRRAVTVRKGCAFGQEDDARAARRRRTPAQPLIFRRLEQAFDEELAARARAASRIVALGFRQPVLHTVMRSIAELAGVFMLNDPGEQTIIIADNDSMMRGILRSVLARPGRVLKLASDGDEAVRLAEEQPAVLVMLDLKMPRMDGISAARLIRAVEGYDRTPIVILTGVPNEQQRQAAKRLRAEFWTKPITIEDLRKGLAPLIAMGQHALDVRTRATV